MNILASINQTTPANGRPVPDVVLLKHPASHSYLTSDPTQAKNLSLVPNQNATNPSLVQTPSQSICGSNITYLRPSLAEAGTANENGRMPRHHHHLRLILKSPRPLTPTTPHQHPSEDSTPSKSNPRHHPRFWTMPSFLPLEQKTFPAPYKQTASTRHLILTRT